MDNSGGMPRNPMIEDYGAFFDFLVSSKIIEQTKNERWVGSLVANGKC